MELVDDGLLMVAAVVASGVTLLKGSAGSEMIVEAVELLLEVMGRRAKAISASEDEGATEQLGLMATGKDEVRVLRGAEE